MEPFSALTIPNTVGKGADGDGEEVRSIPPQNGSVVVVDKKGPGVIAILG
jgi:hypothetical protein